MVSQSMGLRSYLTANATQFNRDLIERFLEAWPAEWQANARTDIGNPIDRPDVREQDGIRFYPIRYPQHAGTEPDWTERTLTYPLEFCADIGATGFTQIGSLWVAAELDAIDGHAAGVGIDDSQIAYVDQILAAIEYVELRRSTRGSGRHIYAHLKGFDTRNHSEHAAIGRSFVAKLANDLRIDLSSMVDAVGGNFWFHSTRATKENRGFELLKPATRVLTPDDLPDWRSYLQTCKQVRVAADTDRALDDEHQRILNEYRKTGFVLIDNSDSYHAHTAAFTKIATPHFYATLSEGTDPGKPNCVISPRRNGAFLVTRFGTPKEHALWDKTVNGYSCFLFNAPLSPKTVCRAADGVWTGSGFTCATLAQAKQAAEWLGFQLPHIDERTVNFTLKHGGVIAECERSGKESPRGWGVVGRKLKRHFDLTIDDDAPDDLVRHLVTNNDEDAGFILRRDDGSWGRENKSGCADVLHSRGEDDPPKVIGRAIRSPWTLVNEPFQPRYLPGRKINLYGAQLIPKGDASKPTPHFDSIRDHCGDSLTPYLADDEWCKQHNIRTGGDYLRLWDAKLVQDPRHPLPFIFLWSDEQDTGKSAWPRSLSLLFDRGAVDAHSALEERFNGQLAGAVLGYIEEKSINHSGYLKLKSWIDAPQISIREMRCNAYQLDNYCHFCQTANQLNACKLEPRDKRVVVIRVAPLKQIIPWRETLLPALQAEAPDYLSKLLAMQLPPAAGRLFLPIADSDDKRKLMDDSPQADRRGDVVQSMADAVAKLGSWQGYGGDLLKAIGKGAWSDSAGTVVGYLQDATDLLQERGITVSIASTKVKGRRAIKISNCHALSA
jgi:hypothetical protein